MERAVRRVLIYGAGNNFIYSAREIARRFDIVGVVDISEDKQGTKLFGYTIGDLKELTEKDYDYVIVTPSYAESIHQTLLDNGVDERKILLLENALRDEKDAVNLKIAILFYGGLGDYIIGKNWLYHLHESVNLEGSDIDAFFLPQMMENARAVFEDSVLIDNLYEIDTEKLELVDTMNYSLVIRFSIVPMVMHMDSRELYVQNKRLYDYAEGVQMFGTETYQRGFFASPDFYKTVTDIFCRFPEKKYHALYDVLDNMLEPEAYHCEYPINISESDYLKELGLTGARYITVNTGANEEYMRKPSTRSWEYGHWIKLISVLRKSLPTDVRIVRMGLACSGEDTKAHIDLAGKTSVEQAKVLLKHAMLHIDYEGGLVHVRHVVDGGPSVVLHGPTSVERYGYEENIAIRTIDCPKACEWTCRDWLTVCHNENKPLICMKSVSVEMVAEKIINYVEGKGR